MGISCLSTIIILQCLWCSGLANMSLIGIFIEIPSSVTVEVENGVEMDAVFRCRHQHVDAGIDWLINGSSSRRNRDVADGFIRESNGTRVDTLTIPAIPEYNGTEVVCVATFLDGSPNEVTPPANLIIVIINEVAPETTTQPPPTTTMDMLTMEPVAPETTTQPPPTTTMDILTMEPVTPEATAQPPPTTTMEPGFVMTPSSLNKTVEQGEAVFPCQHRSSNDITWRVNGTSISSPNISDWRVPVGDGRFVYLLSIPTLPGFNNTTIECGAIFFDGSPLLFTPPVTLLIQDTPGHISNLGFQRNYSSGVLTTFWDPLPTLDITDRDPDIIYRVQIFKINSGCGQSVLMSDENVTESITSLSSFEHMEIYMAVITPRNNVSGYIDGPKKERKEKFISLNGTTLFELSQGRLKTIKSVLPVPHFYTMMLEPLDGIGSNLKINIDVKRDGEMVTMQIGEPLPPKCLWSASILPYNCAADIPMAELSTHGIQNVVVTVNPSNPGAIQLEGNLVDGSGATGVLWMVCSLSNDSDIRYIYIAKQPEQNSISMNVTGLTGTEYGVSVFALENGVPFPRVVTSPTNITVTAADSDDQETIPQPLMSVDPTSTGVCITCTFPMDSSATDCVAVVHQRISQLNSSGLMNIESSHKLNKSGDTAYGCIGVDMEQYQVGVIAVKVISPTIQSNDKGPSLSGAVAGIVLGITTFILIVVVVIGIVYYYLRKRRKLGPLYSEVGIAPPRLQSDTVVNIEDDSGFHHYVESAVPLREEETEEDTSAQEQSSPLPPGLEESLVAPPLPPRSEESMILVEDQLLDSARSPLETIKESDLPPPPQGPPDQDTSKDKDGSSDPTYAQPEFTRKVAVPPPVATERLVYNDIHGFQNKEGQTYALTQLPASKKVVDDLHGVVYSEIQPKTEGEVTSTEPVCTAEQTGNPPPPRDISTADLFFSRLLPHASKWQSLGIALSLDDDRLDEIYTNNETDEACLQEMLELYMMRSDRNHSWEEIEAALERIGNGVQESDSLTISQMVHVHGSTTFSSDVTTNPQRRSPSNNILNMHDAKTWVTSVVPGRRWSSSPAISAEVADSEEYYGADYDFKSEPNIPYSQGSFTVNDNPQCTVAYNLKEDELTVSATDIEDVDRRDKLASSSPSFLGGHCCYFGSFIIIKGYEEELFDAELQLCIPQKSYLELTEYDRALIKQLGLGQQNPSTKNHCQESSEELNIDVHAGTASQLVPQSHLNTTSSSQGMLFSLEKLPVHKAKYSYSSQELQSVIQGTEPTANHKFWTIWKQVSECLDVCSQVCSLLRKSACSMLQSFSSFMPLEYPT